ncbi:MULTISPECIES: tyrosine-protein phosphatase [Aneurinibacillus]|jgi:protein-tyrosine phosphatase|uniref:Tyrosine-protein phosphatase n=1 Tax=Aneurinibacillus danicus TaxID=267746 RepID=A0A511VFK2_9BACL|nr:MULTISPECIES: CpsB/CapC family capsule biosynthesis tyrosine phosphatase [Aneurinibacillus]GEN36012.1 tyrosine protein phosphatase [Aneurinibacillus danicus]
MNVDIHNHILWGLDDGAQTPEDTLALAKDAVQNGITHVIATPHHRDGKYDNPASVILQRVDEANRLLEDNKIPLTILPGMELHLYGEIVQDFQAAHQTLITLNQTQLYVLIELPYDHVPAYTQRLLFDLQVEGYVPIIAHPERNHDIRERPSILHRMVEKGALAQLTAASVAGEFSSKYQGISRKLIEHNLIHFIASDAHNIARRGFALKAAYEWIDRKLGGQYTDFFKENARLLVSGQDIAVPAPRPFDRKKKRQKFLGLF